MFRFKKAITVMVFAGLFFILASQVCAQYWVAMPPYNLLWPLWSPPLSPPNPHTGVPTPVVKELTTKTVLPSTTVWDPLLQAYVEVVLQPGLAWDPRLPCPYLLYNGPEGLLCHYPEFRGSIFPFPPGVDLFGIPGLTIGLPLLPGGIDLSPYPNYAFLPITDFSDLYSWYINANSSWLNYISYKYPTYFATNPISYIDFLWLTGLTQEQFFALPVINRWLTSLPWYVP